MVLPPGFLDELRSRTSLADVVGRKVTWDRRKSNQGRGDWWAPCPFHQEKSASFHADDRKGYYYCFGCQAKGDAISFVRETENVGFMEAVEILAREAGMTMPAPDPKAQEKAEHRATLTDVMEAAVAYYRQALAGGGAVAARQYLDGRGLGAQTQGRFEIGYAPAGRRALFDHLSGKGISADRVVACGLAIAPDDGGAPFDRFRDRIMFPIRDARGRCIAFGGRAMSNDAKAKYLNSPETEIFDKSRTLYNHGPARGGAGKGAPLIVAEGYVDVIALVEAGFTASVAPLGTAITEPQLEMLWRVAAEPVIALDGDSAGLRAARRLARLALPHLAPGRSLRFAILPEKSDPDDLIRSGGAAAMQAVIDRAEPLIDILWTEATEACALDTPDARAALDASLAALAATISDPVVRTHYRREFRDRQWALGKRNRGAPGKGGPRYQQATSTLRHSALAEAAPARLTEMREAAILAIAITTPAALETLADRVADLPMTGPDHAKMRDALLHWHVAPRGSARDAVASEVGHARLEKLFAEPHIRVIAATRRDDEVAMAGMALVEELDKLNGQYGLEAELRETTDELPGLSDDGARATWRLSQAVEARNRSARRAGEDQTEYDTLENGARLSREDRSAFGRLLRDIGFAPDDDIVPDRGRSE